MMNRSSSGVLQSSPPVQQMMAGGGTPNWWNINNIRPPLPLPLPPPPSSFFPQSTPPPPPPPPPPHTSSASLFPSSSWHDNQELPESWGQLLLGSLVGEEDKCDIEMKKLEKWEEQVLHQSNDHDNYIMYSQPKAAGGGGGGGGAWSTQMIMPVSSPNSCVTTLSSSNNMLDFSTNSHHQLRHPLPDHSSECNSRVTGGVAKKARVHPTSTQSTFKVRKEKLGDRITALHQIVSPFGKTDTASVLLEAIGYIRFLQTQIQALSLPYLGSGSGNMRRPHQPAVQGERNSLFPEDPGQLLNDNLMKKKGLSFDQGSHEAEKKDLRSRGLCLVPVSCTPQVGSDNGADYWAPSAFNG